jgi:hypothetical protein
MCLSHKLERDRVMTTKKKRGVSSTKSEAKYLSQKTTALAVTEFHKFEKDMKKN